MRIASIENGSGFLRDLFTKLEVSKRRVEQIGVDQEFHYKVEAGRARITLARPKKHNAMTTTLLEELEHALWAADDDLDVHCVILRGEGLAGRLSLIDPDLLSANKRITNLGLELMGAQTLQRLAAENDARAHRSDAVRNYSRSVKEHGLKETLHKRDAPFGEDRARVSEPEGRKLVPRSDEQD